MISKSVLQKSGIALLLGFFFLSGCALFGGGKTQTIISGRAVNTNGGAPLVGRKLEIIDRRSFPSPFGIPLPPIVGTTTTGKEGKFSAVVPGKFKQGDLSVRFVGISNIVIEGDSSPTAGWRIVDMTVASQKPPAHSDPKIGDR